MTPQGLRKGPALTLPARSRKTVFVADTVPDNYSVSTRVTSDEPVVAERAVYGNNRAWGHDSVGSSEYQAGARRR
jgi:hypothetical protein